MKAILYMSLPANGCFARADTTHPVPSEILGNFSQTVGRVGNLIVGRHTYDLMSAQANQRGSSGVELVVVSRSRSGVEGATVTGSPLDALRHLERNGFSTALVGGGAELDNSFLLQHLIDEIYLNIEPTLVKPNGSVIAGNLESSLRLIGTSKLGEHIVQLQYKFESGSVAVG